MTQDSVLILIAMTLYMAVIIGIGLFYVKRANASTENYFLGGRSLGPFVTAMSAEASDMSGWLLMGLPGVAYWFGLSDAFWTALGLGVGTYVNWLIVAKRLRIYSHIANDSITIPDFISNRFKETGKKPLMLVSSFFIILFFTVYASSCFVTVGKLFTELFGFRYEWMMLFGAIFVVAYTFLGGFLAESVSDFLQSIIMILALVILVSLGTAAAGGVDAVIENAKSIPGFFEFFGISQPVTEAGTQLVQNNAPVFGDAAPYSLLTILSTLSWGLGYFGVPQVLLRFMAIRDASEIKISRRAATVWVFISLFAAVFIGIIGRALFPTRLLTASAAENIFIVMAEGLLPAFFAGIVMAGILAATISSSDSYLLIASSAISKNIYEGILKRDASEKEVMRVARIGLLLIAIVAALLALDSNSIIFRIVSFAWAGFGATFGPIILFSLFWREFTETGAIAGMITGGITVVVWNRLLKPMGGVLGIYELLPAFLLSCIAIVIFSKMSKTDPEVVKEFDEYQKAMAESK